jgi:probable addiction module antidote protein
MKKSDAEVSDLDVADLLKTEDDVKLFLEEALAENDPVLWQQALGDAARSIGMAKIAESAGLNRESLYKALREDAHPRFDTIMRVLNAMGLKLCITPCAVAEKKAVYKV